MDPSSYQEQAWGCSFFASLNQNRLRVWVQLSLPWVYSTEISGGPRGSEKNLAFHIKIQDIAGSSIVLILEDFKAACLQVEFQGRDASDLW